MIKKTFWTIVFALINIVEFANADIIDNAYNTSLDSTVVSDSSGDGSLVGGYASNMASFALKVVVAIGVVMFIIGGVKFILSMGDPGNMKKQRNNLIMTGVGLVLALASVAIVALINSITKNTINL